MIVAEKIDINGWGTEDNRLNGEGFGTCREGGDFNGDGHGCGIRIHAGYSLGYGDSYGGWCDGVGIEDDEDHTHLNPSDR